MGDGLLSGRCGRRNPEAAAAAYEAAGKCGDAAAWMKLAACYRDGIGVRQDETQAAACLKRAMQINPLPSALALSDCYASGCGVEKNPAKAVFYARKAAEAGSAAGQYQLGLSLLQTPETAQEGMDWIRKAAEQGHAEARKLTRKQQFKKWLGLA